MTQVKRMDIAEFRSAGYLQELNRRFLHPLGLALEVIVDAEAGTESLGGVWDYRDDPEGMLYEEELLASEDARQKAERISREWEGKAEVRRRKFGYVVQEPAP